MTHPEVDLDDIGGADVDLELFENERDVSALRRHSRKLLGEIKKLKDRLRQKEAVARAPGADESPRERYIRENVARLAKFEPGSAEWQAEHDMMLEEMQPLIDAEVAEHGSQMQARFDRLRSQRDKLLVQQAALEIATRIGTADGSRLLLPSIEPRLGVAERDGEPFVTTRAADGSPSEASLDALAEELRADPRLSVLIRGQSPIEKAAHERRVAEMLGPKALPPLTREEFERMTPAQRMAVAHSGRTLSSETPGDRC